MTYRLAAIDLDATLLDSSGRISKASATALHRLVDRGVIVAPATARWYQAAISQFNRLGLEVAALASAGADVRIADGSVVEQRECPPEFVTFVSELCDRANWPANLSTRTRTYRRESVIPEWAAHAPEWITPVTSLARIDVDGLLAVLATIGYEDPHAPELAAWRGRVNMHEAVAYTGEVLMTITAAGTDKGSGLLALCRGLGISPDEAVAFGDSDVDLPMFEVAGLAVGVANGSENVRSRAGMVTTSAGDDGVAKAIERIWG